MGLLVEGTWTTAGYDTGKSGGRFEREPTRFRNWITPDGSAGPTGKGGFAAEAGRYHLYIARACPWAHRTAIFRAIKGLDEMIGLSVTHWLMGDEGWTFEPAEGVVPDDVNGVRRIYELYKRADPAVSGRASVPVLWDKQRRTIVSNESADIIRMFNDAFDGVGARRGDYYPQDLRAEIDGYNARIYDTLNNGVYKAGFAGSQDAYEEAIVPLFDTLDWLEMHLSDSRYLCGDRLTEADWRLFTTLLRFDPVYHGHFKCNLRRLIDYPALWAYTRALYQEPGIRETVDFGHIKKHYYLSHPWLDPTGIVPAGPDIDFEAPL
ncbi:MAG: glutathione S-transferase family protein [Luteibacter sp.]|uniref:glutathione S-transferase family protein n=1 Tax=Luteibacter sp. TaxID=1886636 RepID=UPI002808E020|nr:glutathione S-transferase family protein [Luteibacter sp.]MDQ7997897.1 glutathione S-transferase family protein [Luteibacter sp.]MDQ8051214.1 glutathione S-transferase family protein [Luteibacter sp.]